MKGNTMNFGNNFSLDVDQEYQNAEGRDPKARLLELVLDSAFAIEMGFTTHSPTDRSMEGMYDFAPIDSKANFPKQNKATATGSLLETSETSQGLTKHPHYLLIDDDETFGKIMAKIAVKSGFEVTCIASLDDLGNNRDLEPYDAILLDFDLTSTNGFVVAEILSEIASTKPIIMISSTRLPTPGRLTSLPNVVGFVSKWCRHHEFLHQAHVMFQTKVLGKKWDV